jgi:hypothetical protein
VKHSFKSWAIVSAIQIAIVIGSFNLPNRIVNGATWYAPLLDFGRIALLFVLPIGDVILATKLITIGRRKKAYLQQFIHPDYRAKYQLLDSIDFIHLSPQQMDSIELAFKHSQEDLIIDADFSFVSLKRYLQGTNRND